MKKQAIITISNLYDPAKSVRVQNFSDENVKEAIYLINQHAPDLVFLDIEMPNGNGFTLFDTIKSPQFETIFITAYEEYAIKAFRVAALDYLTKPVDSSPLGDIN